MLQDARIRLFLIFLVVSQPSCSRYFKQAASVVSTRVEECYGINPVSDSIEGGKPIPTKNLVKITRYRNHSGFEWESKEILSSVPLPGGFAALEAELIAAAQGKSNQNADSKQIVD
ncbi:hypothetical protein [Planctomicrobium sp. SH527]|uniref:hypothetical protein n=1 Tax=Planctomicrobium sp. SH527 TaxID=3448123 RepID=UPI003F5B138B